MNKMGLMLNGREEADAVNEVIHSLTASLAGFDTYPKEVCENTEELYFLGRNAEEYCQFVGIIIQNRLNALQKTN